MCQAAKIETMSLPEKVQQHVRLLTDERQTMKARMVEMEKLMEEQAAEIIRLKRSGA